MATSYILISRSSFFMSAHYSITGVFSTNQLWSWVCSCKFIYNTILTCRTELLYSNITWFSIHLWMWWCDKNTRNKQLNCFWLQVD